MPYELQTFQNSRSIDASTIEDAVSGYAEAQEFIEDYGQMSRELLQSLVVPFVPDAWDGRAIFINPPGGVLPNTQVREMYYPAKDRRTYREWETVLRKFGLDDKTINGSTEKQVVIIPAGDTPPPKNTDVDTQLQARHGISWNSCSALPIQIHERECPSWTQNDELCQAYLRHLFPIAFRKDGGPLEVKRRERARTRVAKMAYVLVRWFRECATAEQIAADSDIPVGHVIQVTGAIRKHGWLNGSQKACCRRWKKVHQMPAVETATNLA
jgi:hypothetical protein